MCWTLPVAPGAHRGGDDQGKGCRWEREWSWCPAHWVREGEVLVEQRRWTGGWRRGPGRGRLRQAGAPAKAQGRAGRRKPQEAGWGVSWSLPCLPLIPTAPAGSAGAPLTARDRARGMGAGWAGGRVSATGNPREVAQEEGRDRRAQRPVWAALGGRGPAPPCWQSPRAGTSPRIPESRCLWRRAHRLSGIQLGGRAVINFIGFSGLEAVPGAESSRRFPRAWGQPAQALAEVLMRCLWVQIIV